MNRHFPTASGLRCLFVLFVLLTSWRSLPGQTVAYHGVSSATHQANFTQLSGQGYRIVSLSVAGSLGAATYSAVWDLASGPAWVAAHDMSQGQYAAQKTAWLAQGYRPKLVTIAGNSPATRVYAAVFVADGLIDYDAQNLLSESAFTTILANNRNAGRCPVSVDISGDAVSGHLYSLVCEANPTNKVWGYDIDGDTTAWSNTRLAHGEGGERLACLGMADDQRFVSVWYDERVGTEVVTGSLSSLSWQIAFNANTGNGLQPRIIASGGSGTAARFAGSFAQYRNPLVRTTTVTGTPRLQFLAFDNYMNNLLQSTGARVGQLAIAKDGKLVYARAFTRAEAGYPIAQPTDSMRIASVTKPLTAIAVHQADELGLLTMATKPQVALGITNYAADFDLVEMRHIVEFTSGVIRNYDPWPIASDLGTLPPISMSQAAQWMATKNLYFTPTNPSTRAHYTNSAYLLAAEVLRVRSGSPFTTFLQNQVLAPLGITRMHVSPSEASQFTATDVPQHLTELVLAPSELYPDFRLRSKQFAEDLALAKASGGMSSSALDYVRFLSGVFDLHGPDAIVLDDATVTAALARHTYIKDENPAENWYVCQASMSWTDLGNGVFSYHKDGGLSNASTIVAHRTDGVSWAAFVNKGDSDPSRSAIDAMISAVTSWPNVDEFPSYGLPAFPRRATIALVTPTTLDTVTSSPFTLAGEHFDTVTAVNFGTTVITSQSPTDWAAGFFVITNPNAIEVHPPQGRVPGTYPISLVNNAGTSLPVNVTLQNNASFRMAAPAVVNPGQPWSAYIARGTSSGISQPAGFGILVLSFSSQPSVVPGIVSLGLGNQFADYVTSGAFQWNVLTNIRRFDLPPLPSGTVYLETVGFDLGWPSLFPLLTTNTTATTRL